MSSQTVTVDAEWTMPCIRCGLLVSPGDCFPGNQQKHYDTFTCIRLLRLTNDDLRAERNRAAYDAEEWRRALEQVRCILAKSRTVGNDREQGALDAENFIVGLLDGQQKS